MRIEDYYTPPGFERHTRRGGVVFEKWEIPPAEEATISETSRSRKNAKRSSYTVTVPKAQRPPVLRGLILLVRESENYYRYAAYNGQTVAMGTVRSMKAFERFCEEFLD